jgi:hypothetical protein
LPIAPHVTGAPAILDEVSNIDRAKSQEFACLNGGKPRRFAGGMIANPCYGHAKPLCDFSWAQQWHEVVMICRIHVFRLHPQTRIAPVTN